MPQPEQSGNAANEYECWINGARYATTDVKSHMTGAQIRALPMPSIRDDQDLFLETPGGNDLLVRHDEVVPVAGRRFFSAPTFITAGSPAARKRGRLIDVYRQLRNEYGFGRFAALIELLDWL